VSDPRKEIEQQSTFISYLVVSQVSPLLLLLFFAIYSCIIAFFSMQKNQVRRRFHDFVWLHNVLYTHFPACFVPPLPDKHRLGNTNFFFFFFSSLSNIHLLIVLLKEYVKGDRFSTEFIEKRRISLERFIQRIARHPILGHADFFIMFLESSGFVSHLFFCI
jgi:sorting nexin-4